MRNSRKGQQLSSPPGQKALLLEKLLGLLLLGANYLLYRSLAEVPLGDSMSTRGQGHLALCIKSKVIRYV